MLKIKRLELQLKNLQNDFDDLNSQVGVLKLTIAMLEDKIDKKEEPKIEIPKEELKKCVRKVGKKEK